MKKEIKPRNVIYEIMISCESIAEAALQQRLHNLKAEDLFYNLDHVNLHYGRWVGLTDPEITARRFVEEKYFGYELSHVKTYDEYCIASVSKKINLYSESGELWSSIKETLRIKFSSYIR